MRNRSIWALVVGFALDLALGDPQGWPHPVRLIGKQIELEEGLVRSYLLPEADKAAESAAFPLTRAQAERLGGAAVAADVMLCAPLATFGLLKAAERVHPALAFVAESALCYQLLATRSLRDESMAVHDELQRGDLEAARKSLGRIVGRDTDGLDEAGIARAAVETVAENTSDGIVAPMLFQALGGAPAMMLYKAANTLDSMIGYKNERYRDFGWAAAKADDLLNIVPSRMSGALMCAAAWLSGFDGRRAWKVLGRDRLNHASPNSAHTEAACAGALGVRLGGPSRYFGKVVDKPAIGDDLRPVEAADIARANKLLYATAALGLGVSVAIGIGLAAMPSSRRFPGGA